MKNWIFTALFFTLTAGLWLGLNSSTESVLGVYYSGGVATSGMDRTGSPISGGTCASCHGSGVYNPTLTVTVKNASGNAVTSYTPGANYTVEYLINNTTGSPLGYGMQSVALTSSNANGGNFSSPVTPNSQITTLNNRKYAEHAGTHPNNLFIFNWTAPTQGTGNISFYSVANAVNGNGGTSGDKVTAVVTTTLTESSPTIISYGATSFCANQNDPTPTITGNQGGTFSASPNGLVIHPSTGTVDISASALGNYTISYTHSQGVATKPFSIKPTYQINNSATICSNDSIFLAGAWRNTPGNYVSNLTTTAGCDSIVTTQLFVNQAYDFLGVYNICSGDSVLIQGTYYQQDTVLQFNFTTVNGCDSIEIHQISHIPVDTAVVQSGSTLVAATGADGYQWLDCNTNLPIPNATSNTFNAPQAGSYAVEVTDNGCTLRSACRTVSFAALEELGSTEILVFPNPAAGRFVLEAQRDLTNCTFKVVDVWGRSWTMQPTSVSYGKVEFFLPSVSGAVYVLLEEDGILLGRVSVVLK